jgi:hypothetical protein
MHQERRWGGRARIRDRQIMRTTALRTERSSCTDDTDHCTDGKRLCPSPWDRPQRRRERLACTRSSELAIMEPRPYSTLRPHLHMAPDLPKYHWIAALPRVGPCGEDFEAPLAAARHGRLIGTPTIQRPRR